jgi:predicted aldo/keto reductase-like oxidoreductase
MNNIERRQLGRTGLSVTVLGFGAMDLGGPPAAQQISDEEAGRVLNEVLDSGINFIDTAICYGASEARIGQVAMALAKHASGRPFRIVERSLCSRLNAAASQANRWVPQTFTALPISVPA